MSRSPSPDGRTPTADVSGNRPPRFNNGWTKEQEELMAGWADIAACYRWMHDRCEKISAYSNMWITVPVIILSTLTGSANFMLQSVVGDDKEIQKYAQIGIGGVSIFTGILTTLGNFFRYAQSSEANRVAGIAWGKFQRQLAVELALHPKERIDCMDFLKICRAELDRLIEQSPPIPDSVITAFEHEFKDIINLKKPDIAHGMDHTKVFVDTESRMKKMAVDAAIMIKQKRKVWHEAMMPDVDRRLETQISKAVVDLSGNLFKSLQEQISKLQATVDEQLTAQQEKVKTAHIRSFARNSVTPPKAHERGRGLDARRTLPPFRGGGSTTIKPVTLQPTVAIPPTPLTQKTVDHTIPSSKEVTGEQLIHALIQSEEQGPQTVQIEKKEIVIEFPEASFDIRFGEQSAAQSAAASREPSLEPSRASAAADAEDQA
jgi:hypothetical protein